MVIVYGEFDVTALIEINQYPVSRRATILQKHISDIAANYLSLSSGEDVDFSLGFYEQGFTSFTSLEYIYVLESLLDIKLASDTLFNFPNINALRDHLINDKLIDIDFGFDKIEPKKSADNEVNRLIQLQPNNLLKAKFDLI